MAAHRTLTALPGILAILLALSNTPSALSDEKTKPKTQQKADEKPEETTEVKVKDLMLSIPKSWKQQEPKSSLRLAQFQIPAVNGDSDPAELAVFSFGGVDIQANVSRWISQFQQEGRKVKITTGEVKQGKYLLVNLSGTYKKPVGPPIDRKTEDAPGYRVLAVIMVVPEKGVYYLKTVGPDKTVAASAKGLRHSIGARAEDEKTIEP